MRELLELVATPVSMKLRHLEVFILLYVLFSLEVCQVAKWDPLFPG